MKIEEIKELIHVLEQSQLTCLEVSQGSERVRLEKNYTAQHLLLRLPLRRSRWFYQQSRQKCRERQSNLSRRAQPSFVLWLAYSMRAVTGGCPLCDSGHTGKKRRCVVSGGSNETVNEITAEKDAPLPKSVQKTVRLWNTASPFSIWRRRFL